jgi:outer membrane receptor protein involved in Fe transport
MRGFAGPAALAGLCLIASPAEAKDQAIDIPAGTLGQAIAALGVQARVSIVVAVNDPGLLRRAVPAVRGRMGAGRALALLLRGTSAHAVSPGPGVWRIVPGDPPKARPRRVVIAKRPVSPAPEAAPVPTPGDDIVVTASKQDTRFGSFPGAVTVIGGGDLNRDGDNGTDAIVSRVSTVSSTYLGAGRNKLFIRGIADSSFTGPTQATVGQYFGDVRLTYNAPDPDLRLYDVDTVEILEGPQGTLYGAGSLGGIIRVMRNTPDLDRVGGSSTGGVSATWHGAPGADLAGVLNLPIVDDHLGLRVLGYGITEGGYIDNPLLGKNDINRSNIFGGRATLRAKSGGWTFDLGGTFQKTRNLDSQYADRNAPPLTRYSRLPQGSNATYALGEFIASRRFDDGLLFVSSLGLARQRLDERYDATQLNGPERLFKQRNDTDLFSFENRLSRPMIDGLGWVVGASVVRNTTRLDRALGSPDMPLPATGVVNRITEATGYGEFSVELMPKLTLTAGGRYSHVWLTGEGANVLPMIARLNADVTAEREESAFLPSFALSATPLDRVTLYARYQQSFRPGGLAIEGDFVRRFRNDRAATFELGVRRGVPGADPIAVALSVSRTLWRNIQADFIDGRGLPSTANIGDGRIWTVSASANWRPVPRVSLEAGISLNDSKVVNPSPYFLSFVIPGPNNQAQTSHIVNAIAADAVTYGRVPNIANVVARGAIKYEFAVSDAAQLSLAASVRYTGRSRLGVGPILGASQGDYLDTRLSARLSFDRFALTASVTNLTDQVGNRFALGTPFAVLSDQQITPLRPRTVRIGFDTAF